MSERPKKRGNGPSTLANSSFLKNWPDVVTPLIDSVNTDSFGEVLFQSINRVAPIDSAVVLLFRVDQEPMVLYQQLHPSESSSFTEVYLGGAYLLSPLYQKFSSMRSGFYQLMALEQKPFESSDFAIAYFNDTGLCDEANFVQKIDEQSAIVTAFGRLQLKTPFSSEELQHLHVADPVFRAAIDKHWRNQTVEDNLQRHSSRAAHSQLKASLQSFGSSLLTVRELEVLHLMFDGMPSKASARQLGISVDTERGHRKNIYAKLGVASQAQLFSLIFRVLGQVALNDAEDPYAVYCAQIVQGVTS